MRFARNGHQPHITGGTLEVGSGAVVPLLVAPAQPSAASTYCGRPSDMRAAHPPHASVDFAATPTSAFASASHADVEPVNAPLTDLQPAPSAHVLTDAAASQRSASTLLSRRRPVALMVALEGRLQPTKPLRLDAPGTVIVLVHMHTACSALSPSLIQLQPSGAATDSPPGPATPSASGRSTPSSPPRPPTTMVCQLRRVRGGAVRVDMHSTLRVVNRSSMPLSLSLECPFELGPRPVGRLEPGERCWLPVMQPVGTSLILHPLGVWL